MKNIPVYISAAGTATLILQEIPRSGRAYVILQTVSEPQLSELLQDCLRFCRDAGAGQCFVSYGTAALPLPHAYDILILGMHRPEPMSGENAAEPEADLALLPLSPENEKLYVKIYNRCFLSVSHAVSYDRAQLQRIYRQNQQAWIACTGDGSPFGIGELHGSELAAVAVLPEFRGRGTALTQALLARCPGPEITLTVASDNAPALRMYEKLDFRVKAKESAWYKLL